ncbi:MAG: prolyl oligopeptidase family serine peptidase [Candidatus Latescibacteria bacterium]|nr:prolyl oligopeptidase family serine peptidase [Candidatus Latescibacterota bacterium]
MTRNGYQHMVLEYYVDRLRQQRQQRQQRLDGIGNRAQAHQYRDQVRRAIARAFRPRPRRTPLQPRITGTLQQRGYRIEKLLYSSRPGCLVTAHLYIPDKLYGPAPGVIGTCGHSEAGKNDPTYQAFCQRLARAGFVVLIYDPFNQGERDQYWLLEQRDSVTNCCNAHNMMGKQLELVGQWFGAWRAWDGIRALDYLLTRPEVDASRIGLTGNSGGGTMTTWLWALEDRFTMAAPSCFVTTFLANLENELPADCEQYPPGVIGAGLELADFFIARAPDPVLLLGQQYDFFDRRGLHQAFAEIRRFYDLLGAPQEDAELFIGPQGHGFSPHNQEAMVEFFARQAGLTKPTRLRRPNTLANDQLNATPNGNTIAAGATPIFLLTAAAADDLARGRKRPTKNQLVRRLAQRLHIPGKRPLPHYRVLRATRLDGQPLARYALETENGIQALLHKRLASPAHPHTLDVERTVHLYLPHLSAEDDLQDDSLAQRLATTYPLYALDVRGLGESIPTSKPAAFLHPYGKDYMFHGHGLLLGQSYLGRRVHDLLSCIDLLLAEGARKIHLYGRGQGALIALFAALLHDKIASTMLKNAPLSYHEWTQVPLVNWPAACFIPGVLANFDLPDCLRALGSRVHLLEPWGPDMQPVPPRRLNKQLKELGLSRISRRQPSAP